MSIEPADLPALLQSVRRALRAASSGRGALLVERTCVTGSLGRGTYAVGREATGLVLFLNIDLQFSPYEAPKALDALAAVLRSGLTHDGWSFELHVADADCRGGLWATLHLRRRRPAPAQTAPAPAPAPAAAATSSAAGTAGREGRGRNAALHDRERTGSASLGQDEYGVLQLFLAENMTSSVTAPASQSEAVEEEVGAAGGATDVIELSGGTDKGLMGLDPVDEDKARQQQKNLVSAAQQRARREARHQMRHGGAAAAAAPAAGAWAARLGCGVAEARRVFWSRQPEAALRAARAAHTAWRLAVEADQGSAQRQGDTAAQGGGCGMEADGPGGCGAGSVLWSDDVMHLLDVLALHAYHEAHGAPQPTPAGDGPTGQSPARAENQAPAAGGGPVVGRLFDTLSTDFSSSSSGLRIAIQDGLLAALPHAGDAPAGAAEGPVKVVGEGERRLVVLDPCFPVQDLYAVACEMVGRGEGARAGQVQLQRLAVAAKAAV